VFLHVFVNELIVGKPFPFQGIGVHDETALIQVVACVIG
jgi:hypothetical protein